MKKVWWAIMMVLSALAIVLGALNFVSYGTFFSPGVGGVGRYSVFWLGVILSGVFVFLFSVSRLLR
jgi:hypothetical protein